LIYLLGVPEQFEESRCILRPKRAGNTGVVRSYHPCDWRNGRPVAAESRLA